MWTKSDYEIFMKSENVYHILIKKYVSLHIRCHRVVGYHGKTKTRLWDLNVFSSIDLINNMIFLIFSLIGL